MISLEDFSALLHLLYGTSFRQEGWTEFLERLTSLTGSGVGVFFCGSSRASLTVQSFAGPSVPQVALYNQNYVGEDPYRVSFLRNPHTGVFDGDELVPADQLMRSDLYRDMLEPIGLRYHTLVPLTISLRQLESITLVRTMAEGPMPGDNVKLLKLLFPHIQTALAIRSTLGVAHVRALSAEAVADASRTATMLLTAQGAILHANKAAHDLLREADGIVDRNGYVKAASARMREPLKRLLQDAASGATLGAAPSRALLLERASTRCALHLLTSPAAQILPDGTSSMLLLITDPERLVRFPDDVLHAYYRLTPAETEIVNGLLTGYSVQEIALLRRVTHGTLRYQLRSIFNKTGSSGQADLIRRLNALPELRETYPN